MSKYDWNADDYKRHSKGQKKWADELLTKIDLLGNEKVLDLGCGDGKITVELAKKVPNGFVIGGDYSVAMIDLASKEHYKPNANYSFEIVDAKKLKYQSEFDFIFSNAALHWVIDHRPVVQGLFRALKPGGKILLQMGGRGNAAGPIKVLDKMISTDWAKYFKDFQFPYGFYGTEEYSKLLTENGFRIIRNILIPKDMIHQTRADFEGWIRTTWLPYTQRLPEEKRKDFIKELTDRYLAQFPMDSEKRIHVAMVRIEIEALKVKTSS